MRSNDDRLVAVFRDLNQMIPDTSDKQKKMFKKTWCLRNGRCRLLTNANETTIKVLTFDGVAGPRRP